jgi:hypothetical protein
MVNARNNEMTRRNHAIGCDLARGVGEGHTALLSATGRWPGA